MAETVKIERMSYGPDAIAHLSSGKTVFVEGASPGDVAEIEITEEKPRFTKARVAKVVEPSPLRNSNPRCQICGGCPWAHISYATQLELKRQNLVDALERTAHMDSERIQQLVAQTIASPDEWGYRNKIELAAFNNAQNRFSLGMHERGDAQPMPVKSCPLANKKLERLPKALVGALRFLQSNRDLGIYRVGARASMRTGKLEVALWTPPSRFPRQMVAKTIMDATHATGVVRVVADQGSRKVKSLEILEGDAQWVENLKPRIPNSQDDFTKISFTVSAPSFFQVNTRQAENLVSIALEGLGKTAGPESFAADLYCGVGTFTLPLAMAGADVAAIEQEGSAVRDLRRNAERNRTDAEVICDDVYRALPEITEAGPLDCIVVDPPRAGLIPEVIDQISAARPRRLAYVSCDPQTFARDAAKLENAEFELASATPVDMFPQTYHVETVGIFRS